MLDYKQSLVIDILSKEYPEIHFTIRKRIENSIPEKLQDLELVPQIISSFKKLKGINYSSWTNRDREKEISENRGLLLCIVLMFFHPEKVLRMTTQKTRFGVIRDIAKELNCSSTILKTSLPSVIVAFKAYRNFREETYRLYELIKIENRFFE